MGMKIQFTYVILKPLNAQLIVFFTADALIKYCVKQDMIELAQEIANNKDDYDNECLATFFHSDDMPLNYMMILPNRYIEDMVWHESLHCATRMWHDAGANLHACYNDEVITYSQGYIVSEIKKMYAYKEERENGH